MSTTSFSDIYGGLTPTGATTETPVTQQASGEGTQDARPAFSWLGLLILLVLLRVVYEFSS
jgi:hypothetical protein